MSCQLLLLLPVPGPVTPSLHWTCCYTVPPLDPGAETVKCQYRWLYLSCYLAGTVLHYNSDLSFSLLADGRKPLDDNLLHPNLDHQHKIMIQAIDWLTGIPVEDNVHRLHLNPDSSFQPRVYSGFPGCKLVKSYLRIISLF